MPDGKIVQTLKEFVATANKGNYKDENELMSYFPELKNYDTNLLKEFVSTANKGSYKDENELFSYFPEFESKKKVTPPQPSQSSVISSQFKEELSKDPNALLNNLFAQSKIEQQPPKQRVKDNRFLDFGQTEPPKVSEEVKRAERLGAKPYVATESNLPDIGEAINNAVEQKNKEYRAKGGTKLPSYVKDQVIESVKNGDLVPVNENGKSVLKRGAGFFESFFDAVQQNHSQNLENSYIATLPKDKAISYLNTKMVSPETFENKRETAPSGVLGKVGEFLGENIPMLTKATAGAIGGTALAPETGGASFGMFLANAKDMANAGYAQNLEKNYRGIKEQHPEISDSEAYDKANKAALVGEVTSLATNAVFSYAAPKNIQLPLPSVETTGFTRSLTHAIKSYPKVGGTAAVGSVINDIASNLAGNKVEAEQIGENAVESAKEMAIMHFGLWALGQPFKIPSYLRPQAENIVASAPREEVKQFYKGMEERGIFPEGTADKVVDKLNEFEEQKQVVNGMDLNEEQKASITGKLLQRKKIEEENKELKKYGNSFNARIENNDKAISKLDSEIDGIVKTGKVEKFEKDNLTGQTPTEIGKAVEKQIKPVEEVEEVPADLQQQAVRYEDLAIPKVEEEVKATETKEPTWEEKLKDINKGNLVTFTYERESDVPAELKEKISSKGEDNGKPFVRVTISKVEADYLLSKEQKPKVEVKAEPTKTLTNKEKVEQLRAEEQAEYDAMPNPKDEVKKKEIYDRYDKLITPLLEAEKKEQTPKAETKEQPKAEVSLRDVELTIRRPEKNEVIFVPIDALLKKHATDQPSYDIQKEDNRIKGRVEKAKEFIKNYIKDQRAINPRTGERTNAKVSFEPSVVDIDANGKISFEDGRHRVLAAKEFGLKEVPIEVPKGKGKEIEQYIKEEAKPKQEIKEAPKEEIKQPSSKEQSIIDAHKKADEYISEAQDAYDKAQAKRLEYIKKNGYPTGNDTEFDKLVSAKVDAEDKLNRLKKAKDNLLPLPKVKAKPKQEIVEEVSEKTPEQVTQEQLSETETLLSGEAEKRRKEGKFTKDGIEFNRNEKGNGLSSEQGGEVRFTSEPGGGGVVVPFKYKLVEAETLQPSHQNGIRNPLHFIPEAQPKNRNDIGTLQAEESFANNPRFKEMGESTNAYSGAPVVNERNEVVQGNNRSAGLRKGYQRGNQSYKEALSENANKFGFTKEQVQKMKNPILVREVAASDVGAIELGNYDVKDLETGGKRRLDPVAITRRLPFNIKGRLSEIFKGDETLNQSIRSNAKKIIDLLNSYLNQAQRNTLFKEGELTESGAKDLEMVVQHLLFDGGDVALPDLFEQLSHTQKEGLRKSLPYVFSTTSEKSIVPEIQEAIIALNHFNESNTGNISNWLAQPDMFNNSRTPKDIYSPTAIEITKRLAEAKNQKEVSKIFNEYANEVNDKSATLLEEAKPGVSKKEGIKNILKTEYDETKKTTTIEGIGRKASTEQKAEPKETPSSEPTKERAKSRITPKSDIATQARDLATKLRSGEKQILPDWLKADLPKNTKLSGISFEEAAAKALETFADVYEKVKDTAQAISEALVYLKDWHNENNLTFDEKEWTRKFEENVVAKEKTKKEEAPEEGKVGVSHEALKKLAKKLGLKEPVRGKRDTTEEMANRGRLLYNAGADVEQIAKDFKDGMQPTADDISIVRARIEDLARIADEMYAKWGNGSQYTEAKDKQELQQLAILIKEMGTKASEPFTALQEILDADSFTIVKGAVEEKMEKLGGINAKQEKKIIELTEQNKKLKEQAKKAEKAAIEAANKAFGGKGGKESAEVSFSEKAKKVADNFRKLKNKEFVFRDENGNEIQLNKAGVSWNELIELGAKTIEKTGEIADGVAEIINNIKDKEWYQKLSDKDKSNLEKQFTKQFEDAVEETPEAKLIRRLEKQKEDLENGIIKQKNVNNLNPTPEQQEKINSLKEEINGLKENLGLIKSKQEKSLTEEEQIELKEKRKEEIVDLLDKNVLRDLKNPKNMFSIEEKKAIWKYAKEEYLDKGVEYKDMISLVAEDLGLTWSQMNYAITTTETKRISDEMWIKNSNYKKNQNATKRWVEEQGKNEYAKLLKRISDKIRGISVFGHGGIFVGTHAMMTLFDPLTWKQTVPAFFRAWRYAYGNKANYEIAMQELKNRNNYNMAQGSGLKNNPDVINAEEFQKSQNFLGKLGGAGEQGFNAIKVLRQDLFDYHWNKLTESEKLDLDDKGVPMAAKEISWLINNSTGATNLKVPEWLNEATFAGGMEMARWAKLIRNPLRASEIAVRALVNPKKASSSERVFARVWASRVGRQLGFMASALAVNYAMQNAINPKNKVNISNPKENDFGKFKFGDINIDATSGMLGVTNFIKSLIFISTEELEELGGGDTRMEATGKKSIQYLRGKLAPFYQKVSDFFFNTDFSGNVLPYSSDKPRQGKHKLGWTEYLWQAAPLPIAEAAHIMYESAAEHGGDPKIVDALIMAAISGGTGAKPSIFKEKQLQFSEEDKEREPFKFFVKNGVEFKELNPYKIEVEDEELSVKKPLDEYPKETIDNFKKIHKENLTESLEKIQEKGYVYIDKFGNLSISRGEGKPKEKIDLTELNKDQLKKIVSLLNSDATDKTKKEVFNQ